MSCDPYNFIGFSPARTPVASDSYDNWAGNFFLKWPHIIIPKALSSDDPVYFTNI
jgi:hypothetical protein